MAKIAKIERVDDIPLILHWLTKMRIAEIIDAVWLVHGNWQGLTYGQLAVLFITYVIHSLNHRLSGMESWVMKHHRVLEEVTGIQIGEKDATDDRLCDMMGVLGSDSKKISEFQDETGQHLIQAFEMPTKVARYDTTSFNVHHTAGKNGRSLLNLGHSKDKRPDLLQFKQGLGVLDPAGVPLFSETFAGNDADDPKYVPAWREMAKIIGHTDFLYVADSKASALKTRGTIDKEKGSYLFPLPMTGNVPDNLKNDVRTKSATAEKIYLEEENDNKEFVNKEFVPPAASSRQSIGRGFVVEIDMTYEEEGEEKHNWTERRLVVQSDAHAERQKKTLTQHIEKATKALSKLRPIRLESLAQFQVRSNKILEKYSVTGCIDININEIRSQKKRYTKKGRPGPNTPFEMVEVRQLQLEFELNQAMIEEKYTLAGWRIYVTNTAAFDMSVQQSVRYYRDEWRVERGMHRFKKGSLPALPLFLRIEERIKGLMLLLTIGLQVLTLMEFVIRRELMEREETLSGLVPGNPKMKTARPTAERILSQFKEINCLIEQTGERMTGRRLETLSSLQERILIRLGLSPKIYQISFERDILCNTT
ncbi:MAG: transposase [Desulfobacteraceae bacterium]|nr:transposase [Desulfobacteraceae bacterium]